MPLNKFVPLPGKNAVVSNQSIGVGLKKMNIRSDSGDMQRR